MAKAAHRFHLFSRWHRVYPAVMAGLAENMRGAGLMAGSMAAFTLNDACMKALGQDLPFFQVLLLRSLGTIVLMTVLARALGQLSFAYSRRDWRLVILRSLADAGAAYFFLTALFNIPIANITAIVQALPLTVTLAGALFLREPVGWRRLTLIMIGFFGVLLIVRPGADGFTLYSVYGLIAVVFITARDLLTRQISKDVSSISVAIITTGAVCLFAALGAARIDWVPLSTGNTALLGLNILLIVVAYLLSVMVMRVGEISFVTPFRYTGMLWALLLGLFVFGDWPDGLTLLGAAIVIGSGLVALYRERQLARAAASD